MTSEDHPSTGGHTVEPDPQPDKVGRVLCILALVVLGVPSIALVVYLGLLVIYVFVPDLPFGRDPRLAEEDDGILLSADYFDLEWSPGNDTVIFTDYTRSYSITSDGTALHEIIQSPYGSADISPDGSRVVYSTDRHGRDGETGTKRNFEIETARLDGSDRQRITTTSTDDYYPAWSPNGKRLALLGVPSASDSSDGIGGLYTMAVDGSDQRLLVSWDGLVSNRPDVADAFTTDLKPGPLGVLQMDIHQTAPIWAPSGERLAFLARIHYDTARSHAIYVTDTDGSDLSVVFASSGVMVEAHSDSRGDYTWIYVADPILGTPAWSPDGKRLSFLRYIKQDYTEFMGDDYPIQGEPGVALYEIDLEGAGLRKIVEICPNPICDGAVDWSPDGSEVLISYFRHSGNSSDCTDIDGLVGRLKGHVSVTRISGDGYRQVGEGASAVWSPGGSRIAIYNPWSEDMLYTADPDGTNVNVLVRREEDGDFVAASRPWYRFW